jgi:hypothetical protein
VSRLLAEAVDELQVAVEELRALARGVRPAILTKDGLAAALESLASSAPIPVALDVSEGRLPAQGLGYLLEDRILEVDDFLESVRGLGNCGTAMDPEVVAQGQARVKAGQVSGPIRRVTEVPRSTVVPAAGDCCNTSVAVPGAPVNLGTRSAARSSFPAMTLVMPSTSGTVVGPASWKTRT